MKTKPIAFAVGNTFKREKIQSNTPSFDALPDTGYIRQAQLIPAVVPFSSATLWRKCSRGEFPKPVKLSARVTCWQVGAVRRWLAEQTAAA